MMVSTVDAASDTVVYVALHGAISRPFAVELGDLRDVRWGRNVVGTGTMLRADFDGATVYIARAHNTVAAFHRVATMAAQGAAR